MHDNLLLRLYKFAVATRMGGHNGDGYFLKIE